MGISGNNFIKIICSAPYNEENYSIFTENEKQEVYLEYHDELPCDLEITCEENDGEKLLDRPGNTVACGENFIVREDEIFINPYEDMDRYYQLCPHCGYMVNIPYEILSDGIKERIENRCSKDGKLFRKMYLYSELFSLDKKSTSEQKKLLKIK